MPDDADVFDMDSDQASSVSARSRVDTHAQATTSSHGAPGVEGPAGDRYGSIDMCRRAIPVIEADEDICSICLDEFTQEDPGNCTVCGHLYHLQCIMQWAQRSRECPMCFKSLQLKDEMMQELLPFGEYIPPERFQPAQQLYMGLEAWELERILARLAVTNGATTFGPVRRRGQAQAEPLTVHAQHAPEGFKPNSDLASPSIQQENQPAQQETAAENAYPASWPPTSSQARLAAPMGVPPPSSRGGDMVRPSMNGDPLRNAAESLKSRWSAVSMKCKESISKFSRQTNARWAGKNQQDQPDGGPSTYAA